jgi:hypothetical protein
MTLLAAAIAPNALHMLDRAAVRAEAGTLHNLGEQVKLFLKANSWAPGLNPVPANRLPWNQDLGTFADISPADIATNNRQISRSYIYEPTATPKRVLILSNMRSDPTLLLPIASDLNTTARFDDVWNTIDGQIPALGVNSWAGWAPWRAILNGKAGDYLVIERVNLAPIYSTDLVDLTLTLNNLNPVGNTTTVSYNLVGTDGVTRKVGTIPPGPGTSVILDLAHLFPLSPPRPRERLDLFHQPAAGVKTLDYSYVLTSSSNGKTFDFKDATSWVPQP